VPPLRLARKPLAMHAPLESGVNFRELHAGRMRMRGKLSEARATPLDPPSDAIGAETLRLHPLMEGLGPAFGYLGSETWVMS
jgi:hypothetical protein